MSTPARQRAHFSSCAWLARGTHDGCGIAPIWLPALVWSATSLHSALVKQVPEFISARARLRSISANLHGVDRGKGAGEEGGGDKGWTLEDNAHGAIGGLAPGSGGQRHEPAANSLLLMSGPKTIYTVRGGLRFPEIVVSRSNRGLARRNADLPSTGSPRRRARPQHRRVWVVGAHRRVHHV